MVNSESNPSTRRSTGSQGSTMLPAMSSATDQHRHLDHQRDELRHDDGEDEVFMRELDLLDQTSTSLYRPDGHPDSDREEVEREHAREKVQREVLKPARVADGGRRLEHVEEDDREDHHLRKRVEQAPGPAQHRLLVPGAQFLERRGDTAGCGSLPPSSETWLRECTNGPPRTRSTAGAGRRQQRRTYPAG